MQLEVRQDLWTKKKEHREEKEQTLQEIWREEKSR